MLDLSKNDPSKVAEAGYEFNVVLPDGTETEAKVKVRGKDSKKVIAFERTVFKENTQRQAAAARRGKDADLSLEDLEDLRDRRAANRIIGWSGLGKDGVEVPFSEDNAVMLMTEYPFLREQVMEESDNLLNFRF